MTSSPASPVDGVLPDRSADADSATPSSVTTAGHFTVNFAGDVNFAERTADRLAADPATAFGVAAPDWPTRI